MWPIATDVACSMVCGLCVLSTRVSCAYVAEPIKMPFGDASMCLGNHVLDGGPYPPQEGALLRGTCWSIVLYLHRANVSAQLMWRMNAFVTMWVTRWRCSLWLSYFGHFV